MVCNAVWQFSRVSAPLSSRLVSPSAASTSSTEEQKNENSRKEPFSIRLGSVLKAFMSILCSRAIFYFCAIFTIFQLQLACKECARAENGEKERKSPNLYEMEICVKPLENHQICVQYKSVRQVMFWTRISAWSKSRRPHCLQIQKFPKCGIPTFQSFAHSDGFLRFSLIPFAIPLVRTATCNSNRTNLLFLSSGRSRIRMSIPIPRGLIGAIRDKVGVIVQLEVAQLTRY